MDQHQARAALGKIGFQFSDRDDKELGEILAQGTSSKLRVEIEAKFRKKLQALLNCNDRIDIMEA